MRSHVLAVTVAATAVLTGMSAAASARRAASSASSSAASSASAPTAPAAALPGLIGPDRVIGYIRSTLEWYRRMQGLEARPRFASDIDTRARLDALELEVVRLAFGFGHAAAAALSPATSAVPAPAGSGTRLDQAAARIDQRLAALLSQRAAIDAELPRAPQKRRATLRAQRAAIDASLALERRVDSAVDALQRFQNSTLAPQAQGRLGLEQQIESLQRTVPEALAAPPRFASAAQLAGTGAELRAAASARSGTAEQGVPPARPAVPRSSTAAAVAFQPESARIITLVGEWFGLRSDGRSLSDAAGATRALRRRLDAVYAPLRAEARRLVRTPAPSIDTTNVAQLDAARRALDAAADRFKHLSAVVVPLAEESLALADAQGALTQWSQSLDASRASVERYLVTKIALLIAVIVLVLVVSEIWRRALFRYFHDPRRRSHFQMLRRVTIAVTLVLVLVFGLVSQIGSLATYVGFLTAGLAVALQNVILAIVAYFLLIGRYGVRIGDRITLAGVTGRVAQIGLIRIYLLELGGPELEPTGRLVVLSNAVLFQPQAMFKQVPGADYLWHGISLTLAPSADVQSARERLRKAVDAVYEKYRPQIERRHAAEKYLVDFETSMPWPVVRVRYADQGLKFDVRYPVEAEQAALIDREMIEALKKALAVEPALPVAASGEPALDPSA